MIGYSICHFDLLLPEYLMKLCYAYDVPFCCVELRSLYDHFKGAPLIAKRWSGGKTEDFQAEVPAILDAGLVFRSSRFEAYDPGFVPWLRERCQILEQASVAKSKLPAVMIHGGLSLYAIPTWNIENYSELCSTLSYVKNALIKPCSGRKGLSVFRLSQDECGKLYIHSANKSSLLDEASFTKLLEQLRANKLGSSFLMQPRLDFSLDENHAVDFRLLRHRGACGAWEEVATYARIGATSLVSNVSQGGFIANAKDILQEIAGDGADALYEEIMFIGNELPRLIQAHCGEEAYCLGLDIAVDRQTLRPFVLEANTYPGTKYHTYQLVEKRAQYYQYLLENSKK